MTNICGLIGDRKYFLQIIALRAAFTLSQELFTEAMEVSQRSNDGYQRKAPQPFLQKLLDAGVRQQWWPTFFTELSGQDTTRDVARATQQAHEPES